VVRKGVGNGTEKWEGPEGAPTNLAWWCPPRA